MILYQTPLRQHINQHIFHKPVFECTVEGKKYQIIIKDKKIGPLSQKRAQVIGIEDISIIEQLATQIQQHIHGLIYIQFGLSVVIDSHDLGEIQKSKKVISDEATAISHTKFLPSVVENMPEATIIIDTEQSIEQLYHSIGSTHQRWIKKAQKSGGILIQLVNEQETSEAYDMWHRTGSKQGFSIPSKKSFIALCDYLIKTKQGFLAGRKQGDKLGAFAVVITFDHIRFYLYGGSDSGVGVGAAQALHRTIIQQAHEKGISHYDLLGVSPLGATEHHLAGVTQFKQGFGGSRVEYIGNYDYLISGWKYQLYKGRRNLRK